MKHPTRTTPDTTCSICGDTGEATARIYTRDPVDGLPTLLDVTEPCSCLAGKQCAEDRRTPAQRRADIDAEFPPHLGLPF